MYIYIFYKVLNKLPHIYFASDIYSDVYSVSPNGSIQLPLLHPPAWTRMAILILDARTFLPSGQVNSNGYSEWHLREQEN